MIIRLTRSCIRITWKAVPAVLMLGCAWLASTQNPQLETRNGRQFATVVFSWERSSASPPYYSIAIDSTGNATYQSAPQATEQTGMPYTVEFLAPAPIRDRVFAMVQKLNFLKPSSELSNIPQTRSVKTLVFREGKTDNQINFVTPENPLVRQLTVLFENISTTVEFGRRLSYLDSRKNELHRRRRIMVELKQMQSMERKGRLEDLPAVAPVLRQIASDKTLNKGARTRAEAILEYRSSGGV